MSRLIAFVTALHVLAHGLLGCCCAAEHLRGHASPAEWCVTADHAACSHQAPHPDHSAPSHHVVNRAEPAMYANCALRDGHSSKGHKHACQHRAQCQWVKPDMPAADCLLQFLDSLPAVIDIQFHATRPSIWHLAPADAPNPPLLAQHVRLHLALGVLLI